MAGTEKRRRNHKLTARFNEQEAAAIRLMADKTGLSVAALIRNGLLNTPPPRAARRPTVNHKAVAQLLGQLGKIGSNLNQIAKHANAGNLQSNSLELALRDLLELRTACLQALGQEPERRSRKSGDA